MTSTYNITGSGSLLSQIMRGLFLVAAAIGSFFMLAFSAAFAFFVIAGIVVLGLVVFAFLWGRAKLFGKPFGPRAQFEAARKDMEAQFGAAHKSENAAGDGPIIDARRTPEGWSVDE